MQGPLLFAETPRAGRWNHRFLVPAGCVVDESQLARQAAAARRQSAGGEYLAAIRSDVPQRDGGRTGDELLVLCGIAAQTLNAATRRSWLQRLERRLPELEQLVVETDWDQAGARLVVSSPQLLRWFQEDFADELAADVVEHEPSGRQPPSARPDALRTTERIRSPRSWPGRLPAIWIAAAAALLLTTLGLLRILGAWPAEPPGSKVAAPPAAALDAELDERSLRRLAKGLGIAADRSLDVAALASVVAEKLSGDLLIPAKPAKSGEPPPRPSLSELLTQLAPALVRSGHGSPAGLLEDDGFQTRLLSAYAADGQVEFLGPLRLLTARDDYDRQQRLRCLAALCGDQQSLGRVRRLSAELRLHAEAAGAAAVSAAALDADANIVQRLHRWSLLVGRHAAQHRWEAPQQRIAIATEQDALAAAVLVQCLQSNEARRLMPDPGADPASAVAAARRFVRQQQDLLETLVRQDPPGRRAAAIRAARLLLTLK